MGERVKLSESRVANVETRLKEQGAEMHLRSHKARLKALRADFGSSEVRKGGKHGKGAVRKRGAG